MRVRIPHQGRNLYQDFVSAFSPSSQLSCICVHCSLTTVSGKIVVTKRPEHLASSAEAKKMKLLAFHTLSCIQVLELGTALLLNCFEVTFDCSSLIAALWKSLV